MEKIKKNSWTIGELQKLPIFVNWKYEERDGRTTKIPLNPQTGGNAMSNNPETWSTYDVAKGNAETPNLCDGIGFMFTSLDENYDLCGIDIDGHKTGNNDLAKEILDLFFFTYIEHSPSGTGFHIIFAVEKGFKYSDMYYKKNPNNEVECYLAGKTNRYFTYTGDFIDEVPRQICDMTSELEDFLNLYMKKSDYQPKQPQKQPSQAPQAPASFTPTNYTNVLDVARNAKNGANFIALYDKGDITAHNGDDSSADLSLCGMLAFYLQGDYTAIDSAFRTSALMRDKWNREDYRASTIQRAVAGCKGNYYTPPKQSVKQNERFSWSGSENSSKPLDTENTQKERLDIDLFKDYLTEKGYRLRDNVITNDFEYYGFKGESKKHLKNVVPIRLKSELEKRYKNTSMDTIHDFIYWTASKMSYNPILEKIEHEIAVGETGERGRGWDGIDRIEELYNLFEIDKSDTLSRVLIKKWLMQAYCGLFNDSENPFSLDIVLVFQGGQGIGKTRMFEKLAMIRSCFGEGLTIDPSNTDSVKTATSNWIGELGEIGSTMKKDIDKVKAFLTKAFDEYRLPYARDYVRCPRRTSFVGTVNDTEFLIDQTGNRRFATVPIKPTVTIDYDTQVKPFNALQLWVQVAEVVEQELKAGKTYANCFRLTNAERADLAIRNNSFTKPLKGEIDIVNVLTRNACKESGYICEEKWVTVTDLKEKNEVLRNVDSGTIGKVLQKLGYESKIISTRNKTKAYYLPWKTYEQPYNNNY